MRPTSSSSTPTRARTRRIVVTLVVASASLTLATAARAAAPAAVAPAEPSAFDPALLSPPSPELADLPQVSIELAQVPVSSPAFDDEATTYAEVSGAHAAARDDRAGIDRARTEVRIETHQLDAARAAALARIDGLTARLDDIEGAIRELAIQAFVAGGETERVTQAITSETPSINETDRRAVLSHASMDVLLAERLSYTQRIAEAQERVDDARARLADLRDADAKTVAARRDATAAEVAAGAAVAKERVVYEQARVLATVDGLEFKLVALDAYYRAAAAEAEAHPACGIRWWGVAGIAKVEGRHGTYGGATLDVKGDSTRRIIGIQLNGTRNTAVIGDTDDGKLDGDAQFDRAVGPMQFIPETWRRFEADGNEDGVQTPFNMYDATLAAANYLCHGRGGLEDEPGLRAAYFSYNHSVAYVDGVLGFARLYDHLLDLPDPLA